MAHTMLVMMYHILHQSVDYQELGHDYLDKLQPQRLAAKPASGGTIWTVEYEGDVDNPGLKLKERVVAVRAALS